MTIRNYTSGIPFFIYIDMTGDGECWELAFLKRENGEEMIVFPTLEHEDYWDAEHFSKYEQQTIEYPDEVMSWGRTMRRIADGIEKGEVNTYGAKPLRVVADAIQSAHHEGAAMKGGE